MCRSCFGLSCILLCATGTIAVVSCNGADQSETNCEATHACGAPDASRASNWSDAAEASSADGEAPTGQPTLTDAGTRDSNAGHDKDAEGERAPSGMTVSVHIVDFYDKAMPFVPVSIGGQAALSSDINGNATFHGVVAPYTISTVVRGVTGAAGILVMIYEDVSSAQLTLAIPSSVYDLKGTDVSGTFPVHPNDHIRVGLVTSTGRAFDEVYSGDTSFSLHPTWSGPSTTTGLLAALAISQSGPRTFAYGQRSLTIQHSVSLTNQTVALAAVGSVNVSGTLMLPPGFALDAFSAALVPISAPKYYGIGLDPTRPTSSAFAFQSPAVAGASISIFATATDSGGRTSTAIVRGVNAMTGASALAVAFPPAMMNVFPSAGATNVPATSSFTWTGSAPFAQLYIGPASDSMDAGSTNSRISYAVSTPRRSFSIPDLRALALGPPPKGARYTWSVGTVAGFTSFDEFVRVGGSYGRASQLGEGGRTTAPATSFTFAP